jgi:hypothetical protein
LIICGLAGCKRSDSSNEKDAGNDEVWCVYVEETVTHLPDPAEDKFFKWFMARPFMAASFKGTYFKSQWGGTYVKSSYTFDEWVEKGKQIPGAEKILLDFYVNYNGLIEPYEIFETLQHIGTFRSVPVLIDAIGDEYIDDEAKKFAVGVLAAIGDQRAVVPMLELLESLKNENDINRKTLLATTILSLLGLGDPSAFPMIEEILADEALGYNNDEFLFNAMELAKQDSWKYVEDWITRWYSRGGVKNSKGLPKFRSAKEWASYGKKILGIDEILIDLLNNNEKRVSNISVLTAIGAVGSPDIIPKLVDVVVNYDWLSYKERQCGMRALRQISPKKSLEFLLPKIEEKKSIDPEGAFSIREMMIPIYEKYLDEDIVIEYKKREKERVEKHSR